jgi:hypothetical protein
MKDISRIENRFADQNLPKSEDEKKKKLTEQLELAQQRIAQLEELLSKQKKPKFSRDITQWKGFPMKREANRTYYCGYSISFHNQKKKDLKLFCLVFIFSAVYDGEEYTVGDCAYFSPDLGDAGPYLGKIVSFFQLDAMGEKERLESKMMVEVIWFYFPHQMNEQVHSPHEREVFLSTISDENSLDSILEKATVVSFEEFQRLEASETASIDNLFVCKSLFDENAIDTSSKMKSLTPRTNGHIFVPPTEQHRIDFTYPLESEVDKIIKTRDELAVELAKAQKELGMMRKNLKEFCSKQSEIVPTNWPSQVFYTNHLIWSGIPEAVRREVITDTLSNMVEIRMIEDPKHPARVGGFFFFLIFSYFVLFLLLFNFARDKWASLQRGTLKREPLLGSMQELSLNQLDYEGADVSS